MASAGTYKQDLPPKGGYAPINFKRIPARSVLNAPIIYGGLFASMAAGVLLYKRGMRQYFKEVSKIKNMLSFLNFKFSANRDEVSKARHHPPHAR